MPSALTWNEKQILTLEGATKLTVVLHLHPSLPAREVMGALITNFQFTLSPRCFYCPSYSGFLESVPGFQGRDSRKMFCCVHCRCWMLRLVSLCCSKIVIPQHWTMCMSHRLGGLLGNSCPSFLLLQETSTCVYLEETIRVLSWFHQGLPTAIPP